MTLSVAQAAKLASFDRPSAVSLPRTRSAPELRLDRLRLLDTTVSTQTMSPYRALGSVQNYGSSEKVKPAERNQTLTDTGYLELQAPMRPTASSWEVHPGVFNPAMNAIGVSLASATISAAGFYFEIFVTKDANAAYGLYYPGPRFLLGACGGLIGVAAAIQNCGDRDAARIEARASVATRLALLGANLGLAASTIGEYVAKSKTHDNVCGQCLVAANPSVSTFCVGTALLIFCAIT